LQALQNFGHVVPFSTLLAAFASFHSTAHFFCRSRAASCPVLGSFLDFVVLSVRGRLLLRGGGRYESRHRRRDHSDGERGSKHYFVHEFSSLYFHGAAPAGRQSASVRNLKSR
jgi:hypothetical protein